MLRFVLGDDLFFRGLKYYITKYRYQPVETDDLKNALEECTGQNLYWFFDEWVYKAGHFVFDVSYTYNDSSHSVALTVKQTQKQDSLTGIFRMPVDIDVTTATGTVTHRINILNDDSTYVLSCPERPLMVLFDRGNHILKELHFTKPAEDWKYQAIHGSDVVARILALRELSRSGDQQVLIPFYSSCAASDPFWGVREEAVKSLAGVNDSTGAATPALLAALHDTKSNVRAEAASALGEIRTAEVSAALRGAIDRDSSYVVVANALTAIAKVDSTVALPLLIAKLDGWSFHNRVANAALSGIASVDSSEGIRYALRRVEYGAEPLGRTTAMRILRRYGKGNKQVLAKELSLAYDKEIQRSVVTALGDQSDAEAIPVLETIAKERSNPVHEAAERAIEKIRKNLGQ
jgi:aminopeptidase N